MLIITHRKELLKQANKINTCEIAMVEKLKNRIKKNKIDINSYDVLIIDEAHIGNFIPILNIYKGFVVGATATPLRRPSLSLLYDDIINNISISKLIEQGYLAKPRTFAKTDVDVSKLEIKNGEYTDESLDKAYNKPLIYEGMVKDYIEKYNGVKAIVFCVNIEHTINVHREFIKHGIYTYLVHSKMPESERDEAIENFRLSSGCVLVNASIATTGFDVPDVELIIVNRATRSLVLWSQICGRGSRTTDTKKSFTILDYGSNVIRLGFWETDRDWKKIFFDLGKRKKAEQPAPTKICPEDKKDINHKFGCGAMIYASAKICPHCQYIFNKESIPIPEGELKELIYKKVEGKKIYDLSYGELFEVAKAKGWKQSFVERILYHKHHPDDVDKKEWAINKFWDEKNYKPGYRYRRLEKFSSEARPKNFFIKQ